MQIARIEHEGQPRWAVVENDGVFELSGDLFAAPKKGARLAQLAETKLLRPVEPTSTVLGLLGSWRNHDGRDGPSFFVKPTSSLIDPLSPVVYPSICTNVVYEPEIAVVIGRRCRSIQPSEARAHILGFTVFNDVTAKEMTVKTNFEFLPGKSFDTFGSVGPWIETDLDPNNAWIRTWVNGQLLTERNTADMLWTIEEIVSWVSRYTTLNPGDVIGCGTPPEHFAVAPGDQVDIAVAGIGTLSNPVVGDGPDSQ